MYVHPFAGGPLRPLESISVHRYRASPGRVKTPENTCCVPALNAIHCPSSLRNHVDCDHVRGAIIASVLENEVQHRACGELVHSVGSNLAYRQLNFFVVSRRLKKPEFGCMYGRIQ